MDRRNPRLQAAALATVLALGLHGGVLAAATHPDLSGVWVSSNDGAGATTRPQLTPEAQKIYAVNKAAAESGDPARDPTLRCFPAGMPRMMIRGLPTAIVQSPKMIAMISEGSAKPRLIYMNAKHDPDMWPTYMGESVGQWDGDTLVIDTTKIITTAFLDTDGLPHSDALHVTERLKLTNGGKNMQIDMTFDDPKYLLKPWIVSLPFDRQDDIRPAENVCEDNLRSRP